MTNFIKILTATALLMIAILMLQGIAQAQATRRDDGGDARIVNRLQGMIRELTAERNLLKTENEQLITEVETLKQEKAAAISAGEKLSDELGAQKSAKEAVSSRLDATHTKLLEVVEKYNTLNEAKHVLSREHAELHDLLSLTQTELALCGEKNIKMYQATREILDTYKDQSLWSRLVQAEPIFRFKSVEVENIIQEYEDKLIAQQYKQKIDFDSHPPETLEATE